MKDKMKFLIKQYDRGGFTMDEFISELESLISEDVEKWISVEDRLPEEDSRILIYNKAGIVRISWFVNNMFMNYENVICWQPLPEPLK